MVIKLIIYVALFSQQKVKLLDHFVGEGDIEMSSVRLTDHPSTYFCVRDGSKTVEHFAFVLHRSVLHNHPKGGGDREYQLLVLITKRFVYRFTQEEGSRT